MAFVIVRVFCTFYVLVYVISASPITTAADEKDNSDPLEEESNNNNLTDDSDDESKCGVYLAPSTIPGAGLGMHAAKHFHVGDMVTDGDITIPIYEIEWHNNFELGFFLWKEYTWSGSTTKGLVEEVNYNHVQGAASGIGAAINCLFPLNNVNEDKGIAHSGNLHRSKDPGAGAITIYHNRKSFARREIVPGQELFISYGPGYFTGREKNYGLIPLGRHYKMADTLLSDYYDLVTNQVLPNFSNDTDNDDETKKDQMQKDLYDLVTTFPFESRTLNAFPSNHTVIPHFLEVGTGQQNYERSIRDVQWLEEHGKCCDNVKPGTSTIPGAGRGAIATRKIPKGSIVMPVPLIHIKDKEELRMYDTLPPDKDGYLGRDTSNPNHWQLLLNYCYGHPESKILLSPYGMFNGLVNHAPGEKANTKIEWSQDLRHPEWLEQPPDQWTKSKTTGLYWDFIATRDIEAGEEIFIDYGQPWVDAWNQHVANWVPPKHSENYIPGYELDNDLDLQIKTEGEGGYGPLVKVYCRSYYFPLHGLEEKEAQFYPCRIIHRYPDPNNNEQQFLYIAELTERIQQAEGTTDCSERVTNVLFGLPRDAIHFIDEPFARDHQQSWSFRHEITIPDELFPEIWKNNKSTWNTIKNTIVSWFK